MKANEESLLTQKTKRGDKEALAALWNLITPKLFGYLVNATKDLPLAEDILQTTWAKAIDNLSTFQLKDTPISAWLFAIARNECRQHWRKSWREIPFELNEHDKTEDAESQLKNKILINETLNLLFENDREILRLRYIADLSMNEIVQILNLNFITVRVRVHRALARARAALAFKNDHDNRNN